MRKLKRRKRNDAALWILGVGAGVAVAASIFAVLQRSKQGTVALRRDMRGLERRVLRTLRQNSSTRAQAIDVEVVGAGVVELSGYVDNEHLAHEVVEIVDAIPGVHAVFNRMDIRSVESRLQENRGKRDGERGGTRWYGGTVGIGRRRQSPTTDPARRDDHADLKLKGLQPNRDDVLDEVEEMEGNGVEIGLSRAGPFTTDVPPAKPVN